MRSSFPPRVTFIIRYTGMSAIARTKETKESEREEENEIVCSRGDLSEENRTSIRKPPVNKARRGVTGRFFLRARFLVSPNTKHGKRTYVQQKERGRNSEGDSLRCFFCNLATSLLKTTRLSLLLYLPWIAMERNIRTVHGFVTSWSSTRRRSERIHGDANVIVEKMIHTCLVTRKFCFSKRKYGDL